ncbi:MAG: Mini-ribonuclease 3 [Clostridia bacterium]|nr:Mini-ribonuclease 3 [Clostridia bacterium]
MVEKNILPEFNKVYTKEYLMNCNILSLSFVGDAVHTMYIRDRVFSLFPYKNNELHNKASQYCKAPAQADLVNKLQEIINEDELFIYKKGKTSKVNSIPKNCDLFTYQKATGFEAVIGYIYLLGDKQRVIDILNELYKEESIGGNNDN